MKLGVSDISLQQAQNQASYLESLAYQMELWVHYKKKLKYFWYVGHILRKHWSHWAGVPFNQP